MHLLNAMSSDLAAWLVATGKSAAEVSYCVLPILEVVLAWERILARLLPGCHCKWWSKKTCITKVPAHASTRRKDASC